MATGEGAAVSTLGRGPDLMQRLSDRESRLEKDLAEVKRAKEILADNPAMQELFSILSRSGTLH